MDFLILFYFPAPTLTLAPRTSPPSKSYAHKPESDASDNKRSSLIIVVGICAGVLIIIIVSVIIICSCTSGKGKKLPVKEPGMLSNLSCIFRSYFYYH